MIQFQLIAFHIFHAQFSELSKNEILVQILIFFLKLRDFQMKRTQKIIRKNYTNHNFIFFRACKIFDIKRSMNLNYFKDCELFGRERDHWKVLYKINMQNPR
jgi:hypothetical protein